MRAYLLRCAIFVAIGLPPLALMWTASFRMPPSYSERKVVETVLRILNASDSLEVLAVGSSHARAIDFSRTGTEGLPLDLPWNDLFEVEHQIRTLVPELPELEVVFIALSYFSFHWDNAATGNDSHLTSRRVFYAAAPGGGWVDGDPGTFLAGRAELLTRPDLWRSVLLRLAGGDPYEEQRARDRQRAATLRNHGYLAQHARERVARKLSYMDSVSVRRPDVTADAYAAIASTIRFLQAEGKLVVLYTPPYYRTYTERFASDPRLGEMRSLARRLEQDHDVRWLDFSRDALSLQPAMFRDSDHLNNRGRRAFTPRLLAAACTDPRVGAVTALCDS